MYAVIESGGKQYRVEVGSELEVELLDVEPGQALTLERVLLVGDDDETAVGRPLVANAVVEAEVLRRDRGPKLIVFKYRPKARRRVKKGHRQEHTILRITDVRLGSKSAAASVAKAEQVAKTERQRLEEAANRQAAADAALAEKLAKSRPAETAKPTGPPSKAATKPAAKAETKSKTAPKVAPKPAAKATDKATTAKATTRSPAKPTTKPTTTKAAAKAGGSTRPAAKAKPTGKTAADKKAAPKRGRTK
jgi:large subunit ribosomal protein L21